jgi:hypothetical protein
MESVMVVPADVEGGVFEADGWLSHRQGNRRALFENQNGLPAFRYRLGLIGKSA